MNTQCLALVSSLIFISGCNPSAFADAESSASNATEQPTEHYFHNVPSVGISDALALKAGEINRFVFTNWAGPNLPVWVYVPTGVDVTKAPIIFMLHGAKRDPHRYLREWVEPAQQNGLIVVAPEFSTQDFPKSAGYNLGNVFKTEGKGPQDESVWSFSTIEPIFDDVKNALQSARTKYSIYGHSAGSQFVHRFLYYKPNARVSQYFTANAGWYTLPDLSETYPYGLNGGNVSEDVLKVALTKNVVILLGDKDNDPNHESLRRAAPAMRQGAHRFARGLNYDKVGKGMAAKYGVRYGWKVQVVPGVAHSNGLMARAAAPLVE